MALASGKRMFGLGLLVGVLCAIWVYWDASRRDWSEDTFANRPWKWVVGTLLCWIVVFPYYLHRRHRHPPIASSRLAPRPLPGVDAISAAAARNAAQSEDAPNIH